MIQLHHAASDRNVRPCGGMLVEPHGSSQLVTRSTHHTVKSCDELTVVSDDF